MQPSSQRPAAPRGAYKSPKHAQVWFLRRSRDLWKAKYQGLKAEAKRLQNRAADAARSRDRWRTRAEDAQRRLAELRQAPAPGAGEKGGDSFPA